MNFTNSSIFVIIMIFTLVTIYLSQCKTEYFNIENQSNQIFQSVDYSSLEQNCNELTAIPTNSNSESKSKCKVKTVIPKNKSVCGENLSPITNNEKEYKKNENIKKNPTLNLKYDFDLLSSFNNAQLDNNLNDDLETEIKSLNSLENDLISNYSKL